MMACLERSALPQAAVIEELPTDTLIRLGDKPMHVGAADIVAVRAMSGYGDQVGLERTGR
ncbi:hypothetical protein ACFWNH_22990 [Rhodococcus qingshengii]|uniref:hypothetical protein n=1 Tax=Rhodococcus qingshengii TaxID=334542 RepID=UPI0036583C00